MKVYDDPFHFAFPNRAEWTLPHVLATRARTHGAKTFLREGDGDRREWTYAELWELARSVAAGLRHRGLRAGDRLSVMMRNCPEYLMAWFGAATAGVVEAPINPEYTGGFLEHSLRLLAPRGIVVDPDAVGRILAVAAAVPAEAEFFVVAEAEALPQALDALRRHGWTASPFADLCATPPDGTAERVEYHDLGAIICTSGTTGASKGVMMSHAQMYFFAEQSRHLVRLTESDVYQLAMPLFHGNAQVMTTYPALLSGASVVMFPKFSPTRFVERVHEHGITVVNLLGAMLGWVMQQPAADTDAASPLTRMSGGPIPPELGARFRERFGVEATQEAFGQTEISLPIMAPYGTQPPAGACGLLCTEFFEARLVAPDTDEDVPVGEVGELVVRPRLPWLINSGYWAMPEATAEAGRNLWFHTGDALRQDADGWYYFVDRIKDAIRRRGENISSQEVESALLRHPAITECAVVAVAADIDGGEDEVLAAVVVDPAVPVPDLVVWARRELPRYLVPRYWRAVTELPKTPSGKLRKRVVRDQGVTSGTYDADERGP